MELVKGNCPGGKSSGGNCPGGNFMGNNCPGGQLSRGEMSGYLSKYSVVIFS